MDKLETLVETTQRDINNSQTDITNILNLAEFSLNELGNIENPNILVLGVAPYFPEAKIISNWSNEKKKSANLTCVDREVPPYQFVEKLLQLDNTDFFKMNYVTSNFEDYSFDKKYDLILLLRYSNFSLLQDSVFENIVKSLNNNGIFIMSGGVNEQFQGYSLKNPNISLEKSSEVPFSDTDYFKSYGGKNMVLKFKKEEDEI